MSNRLLEIAEELVNNAPRTLWEGVDRAERGELKGEDRERFNREMESWFRSHGIESDDLREASLARATQVIKMLIGSGLIPVPDKFEQFHEIIASLAATWSEGLMVGAGITMENFANAADIYPWDKEGE